MLELEPPDADNPLLAMDQVLLTPHLGGCTDAGYREIGERAAELVRALHDGREIEADCVVVPPAAPISAAAGGPPEGP